MDPDDYRSGFAVWSGTSFATPVLAAELASALIAEGGLADIRDEAMTGRAVNALRNTLKETR
jgi:hypothetical protein